MESQKRERSANFNNAEVTVLVSLVDKFKHIIENKKTDAATNKEKETAWKKIELSFNSSGITTSVRSWKTLKLKYEGIKKTMKKKSSLQRQEMYKTGGGPSNAPPFNDVEEKVLGICSNIKGLEARHDSDTIKMPSEEVIFETFKICSTTPEDETENTTQATVSIPDMNESFILDVNEVLIPEMIIEDNDSQKENKWDRWHPKTLKTKVSRVLKPDATKQSVTSKLDKLGSARLELVQLQIETARNHFKNQEEEHKLKMEHLTNDERRKEEIHALLIKKMSCGPASSDMI